MIDIDSHDDLKPMMMMTRTTAVPQVSMTARKDSIVGFLRVSDPDNVGLYDRLQQHACVVDSDEDILYIDETRNTLRVRARGGH